LFSFFALYKKEGVELREPYLLINPYSLNTSSRQNFSIRSFGSALPICAQHTWTSSSSSARAQLGHFSERNPAGSQNKRHDYR